MTDAATILRQAAQARIGLDPRQADLLARFTGLLVRWNARVNLISKRDECRVVARHLLDSLAASKWLEGRSILDLGTGAGLPGIPLAIVNPERVFTLIDRNGRRLAFVRHVVIELALDNVTVVEGDFVDYRPDTLFDTVVSRAARPPAKLLPTVLRLSAPGGRALLLCAPETVPPEELAGVVKVRRVDLVIPGLGRQHRVLVIDRGKPHPTLGRADDRPEAGESFE